MRIFTCLSNGKLYNTKDKYWLSKCQKCNQELLWNSYSDKEVVSKDLEDSISFDIKIEYCKNCDEYYICII